jgi:predicted Zn-dependent protease
VSNFFGSRLISQLVKRFLILAIALLTLSISTNWGGTGSRAIANSVVDVVPHAPATNPRSETTDSPLTTPRVHPLPPSLVMLNPSIDNDSSDYFAEIKPTPLGYLVWSQFPLRIYLDQPPVDISISEQERFTSWTQAVETSLQEWRQYLPLEIVTEAASADIEILRSFPPQRATRNPTTGILEIPRAAAAQTRYQFYLQTPERILTHRFTIYLSPSQTSEYTLATARHELGHALGIWGHSPLETDIMYFSQVRTPPPISPRDINTLRRIYQQPTQLGWQVEGD